MYSHRNQNWIIVNEINYEEREDKVTDIASEKIG